MKRYKYDSLKKAAPEKRHYKMYKDGKKWVVAGISTIAVGFLGSTLLEGEAQADEITTAQTDGTNNNDVSGTNEDQTGQLKNAVDITNEDTQVTPDQISQPATNKTLAEANTENEVSAPKVEAKTTPTVQNEDVTNSQQQVSTTSNVTDSQKQAGTTSNVNVAKAQVTSDTDVQQAEPATKANIPASNLERVKNFDIDAMLRTSLVESSSGTPFSTGQTSGINADLNKLLNKFQNGIAKSSDYSVSGSPYSNASNITFYTLYRPLVNALQQAYKRGDSQAAANSAALITGFIQQLQEEQLVSTPYSDQHMESQFPEYGLAIYVNVDEKNRLLSIVNSLSGGQQYAYLNDDGYYYIPENGNKVKNADINNVGFFAGANVKSLVSGEANSDIPEKHEASLKARNDTIAPYTYTGTTYMTSYTKDYPELISTKDNKFENFEDFSSTIDPIENQPKAALTVVINHYKTNAKT
ncbi:KxYKxGKxW signal peptide domain-containing protein, partial [Ligilactobacillus equi]|uniref:KxYKxGKxW signal peptide domain-containing protein n=1 Tax=Ligilactobacillus equi TaxID=137357 RepID=UPI002ED11F76